MDFSKVAAVQPGDSGLRGAGPWPGELTTRHRPGLSSGLSATVPTAPQAGRAQGTGTYPFQGIGRGYGSWVYAEEGMAGRVSQPWPRVKAL